MDAQAKTINEVLNSGSQYLIPFFQREYSWKQRHWKRLWIDVLALLSEGGGRQQHFLGPLVCTPDNLVPEAVTSYQLIDGQQRLTTISLLLMALRDVAQDAGESALVEQVTEQYLIHKYQKKHKRLRVLPRVSDRDAYLSAIGGEDDPTYKKFGVYKARRFFRKRVEEYVAELGADGLIAIFHAVTACLSLVVITIDGENPYEIFESLNSTGLPLEESDLVRNYIFMQVNADEQEEFHATHWKSLEAIFGEGEHKRFLPTIFYRNYLMREGRPSRPKMTFLDFKEQNKTRQLAPVEQAAELTRFAKFESMIRYPEECESPELQDVLSDIRLLEITTAHPLLLNLLDRWKRQILTLDELLSCLQDLSSFVLRRSICGQSTRAYNRYFPEAASTIKDDTVEDLKAYWIKRGWPCDEAFTEALVRFPIYHRESRKAKLVLERLELATNHKEPVKFEELSIEHVLPQRIDGPKGKPWRDALGEDWFEQHTRWVHTIGNLTLTGYNSEMSNSAFQVKQPKLVGSHLELNKLISTCEHWGVEQITQRAKALAQKVAAIWPAPDATGILVEQVEPSQGSTKLKPGVARRERYWSEFAKLIVADGFSLLPIEVTGKTKLFFDSGHPDVSFWARIVQNRAELQVGMTFYRKEGRARYSQLHARRKAIDTSLELEPTWQEGYKCHLSDTRSNSRVKDLDDWPAQQSWLSARLRRMHRALGPMIHEANLTD